MTEQRQETEYLDPGHLREQDMRPEFRQAEEAFREGADFLWGFNDKIMAEIRADLSLSLEERLEAYQRRYQREIAQPFYERANQLYNAVVGARHQDESLLVAGAGPQFGQYVASLAGKGKGELEQVMATAQRTGQADLARAAAQVALDNNWFGVFDGWVKADPQRAAALKRIRTTPPAEQIATRIEAFRPIKAQPDQLVPRREDHELQVKQKTFERMNRESFFGPAIRVFHGRHVREV